MSLEKLMSREDAKAGVSSLKLKVSPPLLLLDDILFCFWRQFPRTTRKSTSLPHASPAHALL